MPDHAPGGNTSRALNESPSEKEGKCGRRSMRP